MRRRGTRRRGGWRTTIAELAARPKTGIDRRDRRYSTAYAFVRNMDASSGSVACTVSTCSAHNAVTHPIRL
jgi:hypothetical protein